MRTGTPGQLSRPLPAGDGDRGARAHRFDRIAEIVGAVVRRAIADRGAAAVALIDDLGPEAELAADWLGRVLAEGSLLRISETPRGVESLLQTGRAEAERDRVHTEALRFAARLVRGSIVANPINRTAMLLSGDPPPDPLLPLADLYASEVEELAGGWSAPLPVRELAKRAGGVVKLDAALRARLEMRDPAGLGSLPEDVAREVEAALARGSSGRRGAWIVPKIGYRTLGVDLFD